MGQFNLKTMNGHIWLFHWSICLCSRCQCVIYSVMCKFIFHTWLQKWFSPQLYCRLGTLQYRQYRQTAALSNMTRPRFIVVYSRENETEQGLMWVCESQALCLCNICWNINTLGGDNAGFKSSHRIHQTYKKALCFLMSTLVFFLIFRS